jgi:hypothetical protein
MSDRCLIVNYKNLLSGFRNIFYIFFINIVVFFLNSIRIYLLSFKNFRGGSEGVALTCSRREITTGYSWSRKLDSQKELDSKVPFL